MHRIFCSIACISSARPHVRTQVLGSRSLVANADGCWLHEQVSAEGAALVETQTNALFGDVKALTRQMQEAVGNVNSLEEVMKKVQVRVSGLPGTCYTAASCELDLNMVRWF